MEAESKVISLTIIKQLEVYKKKKGMIGIYPSDFFGQEGQEFIS